MSETSTITPATGEQGGQLTLHLARAALRNGNSLSGPMRAATARNSGSMRTEQAVAKLGRRLAQHRGLTPVGRLPDELGAAA
jgi:hypothetical protein